MLNVDITSCQESSHLVFSSCSFPIFLISRLVILIIVVIPQEPFKQGSGENENSLVSRNNSGREESRNKSNKKKTT